jgi:hypothetical protein
MTQVGTMELSEVSGVVIKWLCKGLAMLSIRYLAMAWLMVSGLSAHSFFHFFGWRYCQKNAPLYICASKTPP